ncbi:hypothetical protein H0266_15005 [Halobacillus locisalis]|uniref:Uncharacterized protein n=1 Tax=Halobacillus locisalis TaxID=220753 RepID=A0A838CW96_9BACI|nr:hypothetical protein [Halobacillus locisalis]MBA2176204.1 hypothetical protein [Halobacillus locisalis]
MSDYVIEHLTRYILQSLPEHQRALYTYVIDIEDHLADMVATEGEFMARLETDRPHQQAADHLGMTLFELLQSLKDIEEHISDRLEHMVREVSLIDCTHLKTRGNQQLFYVPLPRLEDSNS